MTAVWIVVALGISGAAVQLVMAWRRRDHATDLGEVSHQWIAEHQFGRETDAHR
jgi:hypothetical protein